MSDTVHRERELKFEVPEGFAVPDVADVLPGADVERRTVALRSTYYDTVSLDLLAQKITLRRRSGDTDTGWQLKIPAGDARDEIAVPLGGSSDEPVPDHLARLVAGVARAAELTSVATLSTQRHLTRMLRDGELVVEIADDHVVAATGGRQADTWREVEIELGPAGTEDDLAAFATRLRRDGARPSRSGSKVARALGRDRTDRAPRSRAGELVAACLESAHRRLVAGDIALRRGHPDVHRTRVAVGRIRAVLRVFRDVLGGDAGGTAGRALDAELSWLQDLLGEVRDRQVQRARLRESLAGLPTELGLETAATQIDRALCTEEADALDAVRDALATNRYRRLLATVAALTAGDPVTSGVSCGALRKAADHAAGIASRRLRRARESGDTGDLHRARRAVTRARYAAELVGRSARTITGFEQVQDVLGEHRDAEVAATVVRRLAAAAEADESDFALGLLYQRELGTAARLREAARELRVPR